MKYLLDTNLCVFVIRQRPQRALDRFREHDPGDLGVSTITEAELRYLSLSVVVVTNNISEYSRVVGLKVEDWTQP